MYREFLPPPHLRHAIACLWVRWGTGEPVRVIPDGCVDIVWRHGAGASIAGPDTSHWFSAPDTDQPMRCQVPRRRRWAGARAPALRASRSPRRARGSRPCPRPAPGRLIRSRRRRAAAHRARGRACEHAAAGPRGSGGGGAAARLQRVNRLADELGFSERQLRRRFDHAVGYGPKILQRILRLRRFLAGPGEDIAAAAIDAGYADQAHLTRECRALTGLAPSEWVSARRASGAAYGEREHARLASPSKRYPPSRFPPGR
jgi:AraC-like DNA-binding protein